MTKSTLFALFVALLMVGCGESAKPPEGVDMTDTAPEKDAIETLVEVIDGIDALLAELPEADEKNAIKASKKENDTAVDWSKLRIRDGVTYILDTDKPFTGYAKRDFENGRMASYASWKDGKPNGRWLKWYKNGRMASYIEWKDGQPNGTWTEWYDNEQKKLETNYKDGKLTDGFTTSWYENGNKKEEINFKDGKRDGVAIYYNEDGTEESRKTFKDDELVED